MSFLTGTKGKWSQQSLLGKEQMPGYQQLQGAIAGQGAGGAFGTAADYYRNLLSNDNETFDQLAAPELRRFREQTIPDLSEQFAGMGSGGLSSSGFRNASINASTDLSERLGAIRAGLRQQAAQGLSDIGQMGLQRFNENVYTQGQPGMLQNVAGGIGQGVGLAGGAYLGGLLPGFGSAARTATNALTGQRGDPSQLYQSSFGNLR
jgi:hypothetical protein